MSALQLEEQRSTSTLSVFWQAGQGVFDSFRLQLLDERGTLVSNISTAAQAIQHTFTHLTPGKPYRVLIRALSGGVSSNDVEVEGRTCVYTSLSHIYPVLVKRPVTASECVSCRSGDRQ